MLQFPEPPAAASGVEYESLEARCQWCRVNGGDEEPCISEIEMGMSQAQTGFPCPYREPASHDDGTLLRLVSLATQPGLGHIWQTAFAVAFDDLSPDRRRHRMEMLIAALADDRVTHQLRKLRDTASSTPAKQESAN